MSSSFGKNLAFESPINQIIIVDQAIDVAFVFFDE